MDEDSQLESKDDITETLKEFIHLVFPTNVGLVNIVYGYLLPTWKSVASFLQVILITHTMSIVNDESEEELEKHAQRLRELSERTILPYAKVRVRKGTQLNKIHVQSLDAASKEEIRDHCSSSRGGGSFGLAPRRNRLWKLSDDAIDRCVGFACSLGIKKDQDVDRWNRLFSRILPECGGLRHSSTSSSSDDDDELNLNTIQQETKSNRKRSRRITENRLVAAYIDQQLESHCPNVARLSYRHEVSYSSRPNSRCMTAADLLHHFANTVVNRRFFSDTNQESIFTLPNVLEMYLDRQWAVVFVVGERS